MHWRTLCNKTIPFVVYCMVTNTSAQWYLPVNATNNEVALTRIGNFGELRAARTGIPAHYHTGVDIVRPSSNYENLPVFPAHAGVVVSVRTDGPFSQIIIEHQMPKDTLWTVYEHVHVVHESVGDTVTPSDTIAFFFSREELDRYGWQFDHLHFEILKARPLRVAPSSKLPNRRFQTFAVTCYSRELLDERQYNPLLFLHDKLGTR